MSNPEYKFELSYTTVMDVLIDHFLGDTKVDTLNWTMHTDDDTETVVLATLSDKLATQS